MDQDHELLLEISGHTETTGSEAYSTVLSKKRAAAVKHLLVKSGLSPERILLKAEAFYFPFASNEKSEGQLLNRRADFSIFKLKNGQRDYYYKDNFFIKPLTEIIAQNIRKNEPAKKIHPSMM